MFDFVLPAGLKEFVSSNMRLIVFSFILIQIAAASGFAYWCYKSQFGTCVEEKNARLSFPFKRIFCFQNTCDILTCVSFSALLSLFGWLIVDNSELCWPDQSHISAGAMRGDLWMQIVPQTGRFSPLLHQEFLLLAGILKSATAYYLLAVAELILIVLGLIFILPVKSLSIRLLLIASLVFSAGFAVPISGLIFPEAHIILSLIIFLSLAKINHEHAENYGLALFSSICQIFIAIYLIYLKEPMFLVLGGYSIIYLMHEIINKNANESFSKKIHSVLKKHPVELSILCASFIFAIAYFFCIFLQTQERYGSKQDRGVTESLLSSFTHSPLVVLYFIGIILRLLQLNKHAWNPVWDSMTFSFIFYYIALIINGLSYPYYYVLIGFASILLSAKIISNLQLNVLGKLCLSLVGIFIVYSGVIDSVSFFRNRELYMISRKLAVETVDRFTHSSSGSIPSAIYFLEENDGYDTGQFVSFINFSSVGPAEFYTTPANTKKPLLVLVVPFAREDLDFRKYLPAGSMFIGLPNLGGRNIDLNHNVFKDYKKPVEIMPLDHLPPWKKRLYSIIHRLDSQKQFQGVVVF